MKKLRTDSYHTPQNTPRALGDRLALGSGAYLYGRFAAIIIRSRLQVANDTYDNEAFIRSGHAVMRLVESCNGRFHITGLNHLRDLQTPVVFVCNHMSTLENNIFPYLIAPFRRFTYVIKQSLLDYPIFGPLLASQEPIPVGRENPREDLQFMLTEGAERLNRGISIMVYPQHTRTTQFDPQAFNSIGAKLARRSGVPIMPIAIKTDFWQNGRLIRDFGPIHRHKPIHMAFGSPIPPDTNSKDAHQQVITFIGEHLAQWQREVMG